MLMHQVTFPTPAPVSLDAAGVLTDGAAETGGKKPKIPAQQVFLLPHAFRHSSPWKEGEGGERVEMLSRGLYHKLAR